MYHTFTVVLEYCMEMKSYAQSEFEYYFDGSSHTLRGAQGGSSYGYLRNRSI